MTIKPYRHEVKYYECDRMGITHHSNYVRFMEEARVDWMDQLGYGFDRMEAEGVVSPVVGIECRYRHTTTFKDIIEIAVSVAETTPLRIVFNYTMKVGGKLVCIPAGKVGSTASHFCFIALWKRSYEFITAGRNSYFTNLFIRSRCLSHTDIIHDRIVKQPVILRYIRHLIIELFQGDRSQVFSVHLYRAVRHIPESCDKFCNCGFSAPGRSDECGKVLLRDREVDTVKNFFVFMIRIVDVTEFYVMRRERNRCLGMLLLFACQQLIYRFHGSRDFCG